MKRVTFLAAVLFLARARAQRKMLETTLDTCRAAFRADPTLTPSDRNRLVKLLRNGKKVPEANPKPDQPFKPRLLRRAEVAERLGRTVRSVDSLCRAGVLQKVRFPGRQFIPSVLRDRWQAP